MSAPVASYFTSVLLVSHRPTHGLTAIQRHWRRLVGPSSDPYRPELHYMRGPGPKWREKHARADGRNRLWERTRNEFQISPCKAPAGPHRYSR